jgi:hypothetical protein
LEPGFPLPSVSAVLDGAGRIQVQTEYAVFRFCAS